MQRSSSKIAIVGEAWGAEEEEARQPFVGASGRFLNYVLRLAGINRDECLTTNVFNLRPRPTNDVANLCGKRHEGIPNMPPIAPGNFIRAEYAEHLTRLWYELDSFKPNLILALGNTALWATTGQTAISKYRGSAIEGHHGYKVLPTYHPSNILREYSNFPVFVSDLQKAAREGTYPEIRRVNRFIHIEPDLDDIRAFVRDYIDPSDAISIDIETARDQITEIGFAPSIDRAIVIPFVDDRKADKNYWPDLTTELEVWQIVRDICESPRAVFVGQNYNYDMMFLYKSYGIRCFGANHDTMLLHHALQPELKKGLGMLASIYTDERPWKFMRPKHTVKQGDE